jgi:hypothetical protein
MRRSYRDLVLSSAFVIAIALPMLLHARAGLLGSTGGVLKAEARAAARFPELGEPGFAEGLGAWMEDGFGLRASLLGVYASLRDELRLDPADGQAVVGRDGWLFLSLDGRMRREHQARFPPGGGNLSAWRDFAAGMQAEAEARGMAFAMLIAPDKQTIYPELLPASFGEPWGAPRRAYVARAVEEAGVPVADATEHVAAAKAGGETHYRRDTHWTSWGAYHGYVALIETLREVGMDVSVVGPERLREGSTSTATQGDLERMLGRENSEEERRSLVIQDGLPVETRRLDDAPPGEPSLGTLIVTGGPADAPRLLLYGDSFSSALLPFLAQTFSEVTIIRREGREVDLAKVDRHEADILVFETVERNIRKVPILAPSEGA